MALISIKRNVDLQPGLNAPAVFNCSQSDKGTTIMLGLINGGNDYTVPSGVTITIRGSRSNGAVFTPVSATSSGSTVSFTLTEEMTDTAGPTLCEAVLEQGNNVLGTANFIINVEGSPMGADVPPVFTDAAWTWMLGKLTTETVPALGDDVISSIQGKVDKSQGSTNAKKFLRVNTSGNVSLASTDKTLSVADQIADAKETGDQIRALDAEIDGVVTTLGGSISTLNGITTDLQSSKLNKNQGTSNAGKTMVVDSNGNIVPGDVPITIDDTLSIADAAADAKAAGDAIALKANTSTIAPEFSDQNTYTAGSYVLKNGVLYKFMAAHSGAWTGTDAEVVTVGESLETKINMVESTASGNVATFVDAVADSAIKKIDTTLTATQEGTGNPSLTNIRNITGLSGYTINQSGEDTSTPIQHALDWSENGAFYTGDLTYNGDGTWTLKPKYAYASVDYGFFSNATSIGIDTGNNAVRIQNAFYSTGNGVQYRNRSRKSGGYYCISNVFKVLALNSTSWSSSQQRLYLENSGGWTTKEEFLTSIQTYYNNGGIIQFLYDATDTIPEYTFTDEQITALSGVNKFWCAGDTISVVYVVDVVEKIKALTANDEDSKQFIVDGLTETVTLPRSLFVYHQYYNDSGTAVSGDAYTRSQTITIDDKVSLKVGQNLTFRIMHDNGTFTEWMTEGLFPNIHGKIIMKTIDGSNLSASYIDAIEIKTTKYGHDEFYKMHYVHIDHTRRFDKYSGQDNILRGKLGVDADDFGMSVIGNTGKRITTHPHISEWDLDIYCGLVGTGYQVTVIVNNAIYAVLENGDRCHIPANTPFVCGFYCQSYDSTSTNDISIRSIMVVNNNNDPDVIAQYLTNTTTTRADASFIADNGKIFMVTYDSDGKYSVKQGSEFLVNMATLDHNPGHANSCNYHNGYCYVSDWTVNNLIHVYAVDETNNTLMYSKDIELPESSYGRTEYYVFDNENQIYFVGWMSGASGINPNALVYGLYIKTSIGYVKAWERFAARINLLQGITYQEDYLYLVENDNNYDFTAVYRIDLHTGVIEYSRVTTSGTISEAEIESIIPIGHQTFIATDATGRTFLYTY